MASTILVVDAHPTSRLGIRAAFDGEEDLAVVGEAGNSEAAMCLAGELRPDLVVQDLGLDGDAAGANLCKELKDLPVAPQILVHTECNSHQDIYSCFLAGADSFVHKGEESCRLVETAREVAQGKRVWLLGKESKDAAVGRSVTEGLLTQKEAEVLAFVLEGCSNPWIADELCLSCSTVKSHLSNVYRKLGVSGRKDLFGYDGASARGA